MFTLKLYADDGFRQRIVECESFTVLRPTNCAPEITCHGVRDQGAWHDIRFDIVGNSQSEHEPEFRWDKAILENSNGKTTEIVYSNGYPAPLTR